MNQEAPPPADYAGAAKEQAQSSREVTEQQTWANRPDQYTPWGSQTWTNEQVWDPSTEQYLNRWRQDTNLSPEMQMALDAQTGLQLQRSGLALGLGERMEDEYMQKMNWDQFTPMGQNPDAPQYDTQGLNQFGSTPQEQALQRSLNTSGLQGVDPSQRYYQQAGDAVYNQWAERALPAQKQAEDALRTRMYNQGLKEGDQAYDAEMNKLRQSQGDAQRQAAMQATQMAGSEASRMYGMDQGTRNMQFNELQQAAQFGNQAAQQALQQQQSIAQYQNQLRQQQLAEQMGIGQQNYGNQMQQSQYQNTLRQQQIAEAMQQRGFSLNEINALLSGQQVSMPSMPSFNQAQRSEGIQALNAAQMQDTANLNAFNAEQQAMQGMMQGISGIAGGMMMSSRDVKKRIKRIGTTPGGTPLYRFQYVWGGPMQIGVMADEAPAEAVVNINGAIYVDYSKVK